MRRLPIFILLDVSESMAGENRQKMEDAIGRIVASLRRDPHALETVHISIIAFAGVARTLVPLVDVAAFYPPKLPIGSGTNLGAALRHLSFEMEHAVLKTTAEQKGDWRPIIYLLTDGKPTDDVQPAIDEWTKRNKQRLDLIAIGLGRFADLHVLSRITDHVLLFEGTSDDDFLQFVNWITASVTEQSRSVGEVENQGVRLAKIDEAILKRIGKDVPSTSVDNDCVVLAGRCQRSGAPYLMKYDREANELHTQDFSIDLSQYILTGCYPVDESYFAWSDPTGAPAMINTLALQGVPSCPYCGNPSAFARCGCGKLLCVGGPGPAVCPWCGDSIEFTAPTGDEGGFDIGRGKG